MADLRIGTCSWKYGSWKGLLYSASSGINFLEEYARSTPEDFVFTVKVPNSVTLTHFYRKGRGGVHAEAAAGVSVRGGDQEPQLPGRTLFRVFLHQNGLIPVFLQGYYMPSILGIFDRWSELVRGFPALVIRLHGPNRQKIEKKASGNWSRIIEPKDEELSGVADIVTQMQSWGVSVYLNVNNHYEGSAPLTIDRFQRLLPQSS